MSENLADDTRCYTYKEIAAVMGISYQAVQQLEQSALRKLFKSAKLRRLLREMLER